MGYCAAVNCNSRSDKDLNNISFLAFLNTKNKEGYNYEKRISTKRRFNTSVQLTYLRKLI